jgi:hypothetical protein
MEIPSAALLTGVTDSKSRDSRTCRIGTNAQFLIFFFFPRWISRFDKADV